MKMFVFLLTVGSFTHTIGQNAYDQARNYLNENKIDSARLYANRLLSRRPSSEDYFLSGLIHEAENKPLRALSDYEAAVKIDPDLLEAYFQKGLIYYNSASSEQAIMDFTTIIDRFDRSPTRVIYFANDPFGSRGTFITSLQSMLGRVYQYRGLAHQKIGRYKQAISDFDASFRYDTLAEYYINRSQLHTTMDRNDQAISDLKQAIKREPRNYLAWYNLAVIDNTTRLPDYLVEDETFAPMMNLLGSGAYENEAYRSAISYFTKAIENNRTDKFAYVNRGKSRLKTGAYSQARADFLHAMKLDPTDLELFHLVGNSFFYERNYAEAIGFYERYLTTDRGYKNVWYNAAMAYLSLEQTPRACQCLRESEKLGMEVAAPFIKKHCASR